MAPDTTRAVRPMLVVTSMRNFKNVPARKQAGDAQWLAELLAHGLVVAIV